MKKVLSVIIFLSFVFQLWSQNNDVNIQQTPFIEVKDIRENEKPVRISQVKVGVKVIGSLAVTTVDMTFHNPNNRIMEGELQFPLAEGQSISRFALDINGKLREGVTVEKAKGQATFESVIRQKVDPALLEKTVGNNFRTRVYPLPENGTRRVVIAYEQELDKKDTSYRFHLPIEYRDKLDVFDLSLSVFGSLSSPKVENTPWSSFGFDQEGEAYIARYSSKDYEAKGQIVFSVPIKKEDNSFIERGKISGQYVFYTKIFPEISEQSKELPKTIDLYWDISGSMENRNFAHESQLLENYFSKINDLTVNLYTFNVLVNKPRNFTIKNGDWTELKSTLQNIAYDGATQFDVLDFSQSQADEILLFSDGLSNLSTSASKTGNTPITVITSSMSSDHSNLQFQASAAGGKYINLMRQTPDEAVKLLMNESFRLISADFNKKEITDFTTSGIIIKPEFGFSMAGKLLTSKATVTLKFGVGKKVLYTEKINLNVKDAENYNNIVERVWAAKKVSELDLLYNNNKKEIEDLGKQYNIVTRNTSLIVLETVEDYIQYKITPPEELLEEYNELIKEREDEKQEEREDKIDDIISLLDERLEWWDKTFDVKSKKVKENQIQNTVNSQSIPSTTEPRQTYIPTTPVRPTTGLVNGTVADSNGEAIIGATVRIKGTHIGVITDVNGGFSIDAKDGDVLEVSYLGFVPQVKNVSGTIEDIVLQEDEQRLEEVVVTGYGVQKRETVAGSVTTISAEELGIPQEKMSEALLGMIPGVQLQNAGNSGTTETIRIRGASSISTSSNPVYVVDGVIVESLDGLNQEEIESMGVVNDASAVSIYGSRAANGVVLITTKNAPKAQVTLNSETKSEENIIVDGIVLKDWEPNAPYMKDFKGIENEKLYTTYLKLRKDNKNTPSFFLDVATIFEERGLKQEAFLVLSNLAEINLQDYRLIRVLGYRFMQLGYTKYAINQFEEVLALRPEEPQSYRDLALAHEQNKNYPKAIELLYEALFKEWDDRFEEIEIILVEEMNRTIAMGKRESIKLNLKNIDKRLIQNMLVDIRIVLNWDTDNSDMDLWVTDPRGEKCFYSHPLTEIGGMISNDFTGGYGPEEFLIKKAIKGKYKIEADYFGTNEQTIIGATTIYLDIFTNYGKSNEKKQTIMLRLTKEEGVIEIGKVEC